MDVHYPDLPDRALYVMDSSGLEEDNISSTNTLPFQGNYG